MVSNYNPKFYRHEVSGGIPATSKYSGVRKVGEKYVKTIDSREYGIVFAEDVADFLADYWDKAENPGAYSGRDKLYDAIKAKFVGISRPMVADFLANLETSQVHQMAKVVPVHRPFTPARPLQTWSCDLVFIKNAEDVPLFTLFTCIDDFSKFGWATVVPDKSAKSAADALEGILLAESPRIPLSIRTDNGPEFKREFAKTCKDWNIKHFTIETYNPQQNSIVERFNKTLKHMVNRWLTHSNGVMIDPESLQGLLSNYNNSTHGTTKLVPAELHPTREKAADKELVKVVRAAYKDRAKTLLEKNDANYPPLEVGDFVRVHKRVQGEWRKKTQLKKYGYQKQWDYEIYRIVKISDAVPGKAQHYSLMDEDGHQLDKRFLRSQLQKIDKDKLIAELDEGHFVPEKILESKWAGRGRNRHKEYLVAWRGFPEDEATWEAAQDGFRQLIDKFEAQTS